MYSINIKCPDTYVNNLSNFISGESYLYHSFQPSMEIMSIVFGRDISLILWIAALFSY